MPLSSPAWTTAVPFSRYYLPNWSIKYKSSKTQLHKY
uniref:Uncharacterized protein n=1 Tax=Anguilla anguilla TaxID=7936 RepID=A0A0E9PZ80_ANGAN